jgi:hypothetical protein
MKPFAALLLALAAALPAHAAPAGCGDAPASLDGVWVHPAFLAELRRLRSFSAAQAAVDDRYTTVYVHGGRVRFNLAWHEADERPKCVRLHGEELDARDADDRDIRWRGPYLRAPATGADDDGAVYLATWFAGCFRSDAGETWCLSPTAITIDGKPVEARLARDPSERPAYGTAFATHLTPRPFTVFVPQADGWAVYQDDWASGAGPHVDPQRDPPWRRLRPQ